MDNQQLLKEMKACTSCYMREKCSQVVLPAGQLENPLLMIIGEAPGFEEDSCGEPFVGRAGQILREALRSTGILTKNNTVISNVLKCRPPNNKFPTKKADPAPNTCIKLWLRREITIFKPRRLLLLGATPLKFVAGQTGISSLRGTWLNVDGIRTLATYHPSYIQRCDNAGMMSQREAFESDIREMAAEVEKLEKEISALGSCA